MANILPVSAKNIEVHEKGQTLNIQIYPAVGLEDWGYLCHLSEKYKNKDVDPDSVENVEITHLDLDITEKISITDKIVLHFGD